MGIATPASNLKELVVGLESGYPPFEFRNDSGEIIGFDVDLAHAIGEKLQRKVTIKDMEFEGEILALKQGKIDLIISGMNITPSRQKEVLMIPYHGSNATALTLLFWKQIPRQVQTLDDLTLLPKAIVSVEVGSIPERYLQMHYPQLSVRSLQGSLSPLMDVKFGKSLANLVQEEVARYLVGQHPEIQLLSVPLRPEEAIDGFGIALKKENHELFDQVNAAVRELRTSGTLAALEQKWFREQ